MQSPSRKNESGAPEPAAGTAVAAAKRAKLSVMLVTGDDMLWPQVGPHLSGELILKQVDSIDELLTATAPGQPAIVLWDARGEAAAAAVLTRLQLHSACFAVVALDDAGNAAAWTLSKHYPVTVYDRELRPGGHSHTVTIDCDGTRLDTSWR